MSNWIGTTRFGCGCTVHAEPDVNGISPWLEHCARHGGRLTPSEDLLAGYTDERVAALGAAFERVRSENWKNRIDVVVTLTDDERALVAEAVPFFTGSLPEFLELGVAGIGRIYRVRANGYYLTIGA